MRTSMLLLAVLLIIGTPRPAEAGALALSQDGRRWSDSIDRALFDPSRVWVPGDRATVTFWVRNDAGALADLRIDVLDARGTLRLGRDVLLSARVDGEVAQVGERLVARQGVDGRPRRIDLTARIPTAAGNETQGRTMALRLRVTLQGDVTAIPSGSLDQVGANRLSATGAPLGGLAAAVLAGLLLALGTGMLTARGRRW